jgi:type I restriction enzyme S subunit
MKREFPRQRLKYAATLNDEALGEETEPDYELQYIDIGNVDKNGGVNEIVTHQFGKAPSRARRIVRDGDVIISCVRTYLQAIAAIENPPENLIVSTGFAVVRPRFGVLDARFCKYALREPQFLDEVVNRSVGVSYPAINSSDLADIPIPVPPLNQQRAIADHLDRETRRIDDLIAAKQQWVEKLVEKRIAVTHEAITRGLDRTVRLRESNHPWLGRIPAHWRCERSRWLFSERDQRIDHDDGELLTVSHLTGVTRRADKDVNMFEAETTEGYKICRQGDLAINTLWAWMGAMGVAPLDGIVSPAYNVYAPGPDLLGDYVDNLVRLPRFAQEVTRYSKGVWSSRLRLYPEGLFEVFLPVPPLAEQRAIVAHIRSETAKLDALKAATQRSLALLRERRAALIAEAVTGRLNVA